jgi:hypothetical protein
MTKFDRREMLKLGSSGLLGTLAGALPVVGQVPAKHKDVPRWEVFELALTGQATGNPFVDVELAAVFALGHRMVAVDGFYDGAGTYKVRFMPDEVGEWSYTTKSSVKELDGKVGGFACVRALEGAHGPVVVRNVHHFAYADGTAYFPFGTTCYAWVHQPEEVQRQTLETLRTSPFNKIRMCIFPKSYQYNHNEPALYPFERSVDGKSDFTRLNPAFFAHIEQRIAELRAMGIEADLILFHPYDRWGYATMPAEADDRYLKYVLARMSAYRNIWWSMANEFDLMKAKSTADFDRFFHLVERHDAVGHLRSVHYSHTMYDYGRPWITHASLQTTAFERGPEWLQAWGKPIVFDEVQYEGNLNSRWGNLSGEEMARRFWLGVVAGCYVTHGETYLDPDGAMDEAATPVLWWSHGGTLKGTSPPRIAFLHKLVEETASKGGTRTGLEAGVTPYYLNASSVSISADGKGLAAQEILYYMDFHQPIYYDFPLPEGSYSVEMIDPWGMTVTAVPGKFTGRTKLRLAGKPFQGVRFRRIG